MKSIDNDSIYSKIQKGHEFKFTAERLELGFENIENEESNIDFDSEFELNYPVNREETEKAIKDERLSGTNLTVKPYQRMGFLTQKNGGRIFYRKINDGDEWEVRITFENA